MPSWELNVNAGGGEEGIATSFDDEVVARAVELGFEAIVWPKYLEGCRSGDGLLNGGRGEREVGVVVEGFER